MGAKKCWEASTCFRHLRQQPYQRWRRVDQGTLPDKHRHGPSGRRLRAGNGDSPGRGRQTMKPKTYKAQSARDAQAAGYGDESYWDYLENSAYESHGYYRAKGD